MSSIDLCGRRTFEECRGSTTLGGVSFTIELEEKPLTSEADPHELEMYVLPADCTLVTACPFVDWSIINSGTGDTAAVPQCLMPYLVMACATVDLADADMQSMLDRADLLTSKFEVVVIESFSEARCCLFCSCCSHRHARRAPGERTTPTTR